MELAVKNEKIKETIEYEKKYPICDDIEKGAEHFEDLGAEQSGMRVLWGYVSSLHKVSKDPNVNIDLDLTYKTVGNVLRTAAWIFGTNGLDLTSRSSIEKNIVMTEKTIAAYFMLLAINDDKASLKFSINLDSEHTGNPQPENWMCLDINLCGCLAICDFLKEIHGSVAYQNGVLTIYADKLIKAYQKVTGKDLTDYGVDGVEAVVK